MLAGVFLCPAVVCGEPGNQQPMPTVTAECQVIVIPTVAAMKVMSDLIDDAKVEAGAANLQEMISKGEAELVTCLVLKTGLGQEARTGAVDEVRYPAEWDPPHLPDPLPKENALQILDAWPVAGFAPTAWETREAGPRIELTPEMFSVDGTSVELSITAEDVYFLGFKSFPAGKLATGELLTIDQPRFHATKTTTRLWLKAGQKILLSAHKLPTDKPKLELFLLKVLF